LLTEHITLPWSGTLDWRALEPHSDLLVRRLDGGAWQVGVGDAVYHAVPPPGRWCFGHLAYDLKNSLEPLHSRHPSTDGFADSTWTAARWIVHLEGDRAELRVGTGDVAEALAFVHRLIDPPPPLPAAFLSDWVVHTPKERYLEQVERILRHTQRGDVYELNYCTGRSTSAPSWDPFSGFARLMTANPAPHAAFYRRGHLFALCASPERYLKAEGGLLTAQPMKGTRRRHPDPAEDQCLAAELASDPKERSENIMAVDVMRNDLSRVAARRSVQVAELCGVHAFPHVHQMTSTITAQLKEGATTWDAVLASFPMASMTGAPKLRAMQLIDEVEDQRRGLFSGTLGFFSPDGDTDLNVVIRTLTYDATSGRAVLITGSAITASSVPEQEWEECELKARSVLNALGHAG